MLLANLGFGQPLPSQAEYDALVKIYQTMGGPNWNSETDIWLPQFHWHPIPGQVQDVRGWKGVSVDASGHVIGLDLSDNNLTGAIPAEIGNLIYLRSLRFERNPIVGQLPSEIFHLQNLEFLILGDCYANRPHPNYLGSGITNIGYLTKLYHLSIGCANLSGSIPNEIGQLNKLESIYLTSNNLSGTIPNSISSLPFLDDLVLSSNKFTGPLPIGNLVNTLGRYTVRQNYLTFSDIIPASTVFPPITPDGSSGFDYKEQAEVDVEKNFQLINGASLTLTSSIDRNTNPPCLYQWFKDNLPISAASPDGHTLVLDNVSVSDGGIYYYQITNPVAAPLLTLKSKAQTVSVQFECDAVNIISDFSYASNFCLAFFNPMITFDRPTCNTTKYVWNFGDGTTSSFPSPNHHYTVPGTYNVNLSITYGCSGCEKTINLTKQITFNPGSPQVEDKLIEVETDTKNQVITASAATFSDVWPLSHDNANISNRNGFLNGSQGVWRNNASFAYNTPTPRQFSTPVNLSKDGIFSLDQFDWGSANFNIVPNWIQANTMTQYSPYSYELENRDVLGIYSAALYDYGGHLPSANGVNMRNAEMGFTSFELVDDLGQLRDNLGRPSGNWMLSSVAQPGYIQYNVPVAFGHLVTVDAKLDELELVQRVDITAERLNYAQGVILDPARRSLGSIQDVEVLCKQAHPTDPNKSVLVLARIPVEGYWSGKLTFKRTASPSSTAVLEKGKSHSGISSLKMMTDQVFPQEMFQLEEGKSYTVSAWVATSNSQPLTPSLGNNLGFDIIIKDKLKAPVATFSFVPQGNIIEGWQQVKGTFICPIKTSFIDIKFKSGSGGGVWYDDLRMHPEKGNMKSYVYDLKDYRLRAILDEENFASFFYYDVEGNLYLTKKETVKGIKTITENVSYQVEKRD